MSNCLYIHTYIHTSHFYMFIYSYTFTYIGKRPRTITLKDNHGAERRGAGAERAESGGVALKWRRGDGIGGMALVVAVRCGAALASVLRPK